MPCSSPLALPRRSCHTLNAFCAWSTRRAISHILDAHPRTLATRVGLALICLKKSKLCSEKAFWNIRREDVVVDGRHSLSCATVWGTHASAESPSHNERLLHIGCRVFCLQKHEPGVRGHIYFPQLHLGFSLSLADAQLLGSFIITHMKAQHHPLSHPL